MKESFLHHAGTQDFSIPAGRVLNYVWINKSKFLPNNKIQCGVPLHYIDQAISNARKYSDATADVWLDHDLIDKRTIEICQSHVQKSGLKNLTLKNLQDIQAYREKKQTLFNPERDLSKVRTFDRPQTFENENIWGRVDLARLLVLKHSLEQPETSDVVYSDFDTPDVLLDDPKAQSCLDRFGMAFGSVTNHHGQIIIENTYFAFRKSRMDHKFLENLITATEEEVQAGYNGYGPFYQETKQWFLERGIENFPDCSTLKVSPPMRYKIPKPREYENICL